MLLKEVKYPIVKDLWTTLSSSRIIFIGTVDTAKTRQQLESSYPGLIFLAGDLFSYLLDGNTKVYVEKDYPVLKIINVDFGFALFSGW